MIHEYIEKPKEFKAVKWTGQSDLDKVAVLTFDKELSMTYPQCVLTIGVWPKALVVQPGDFVALKDGRLQVFTPEYFAANFVIRP